MSKLTSGEASKALIAALTLISSALPVFFGTAKWEPVAVQAVGAVLVYLVPNAPKPPAEHLVQPPNV